MGTTAAIGMGIGTVVDVYGQYQSGKQNERLAKANARIAEMQAVDAIARGRESERRFRQDVSGLVGAERAALAAQGIEVDTGDALQIQEDTAALGELDALTIRNNAAREAWGYRVQAADYRAQGELARTEGTFGAFSTLLTGGAQAYGLWRN